MLFSDFGSVRCVLNGKQSDPDVYAKMLIECAKWKQIDLSIKEIDFFSEYGEIKNVSLNVC